MKYFPYFLLPLLMTTKKKKTVTYFLFLFLPHSRHQQHYYCCRYIKSDKPLQTGNMIFLFTTKQREKNSFQQNKKPLKLFFF